MLTFDTSKLEKSLENFNIEAKRKLKGMVEKFSYTVSFTAIGNTPIGDAETYVREYTDRFARLGLQPEEGFSRGSWRVSMNSPDNMVHEIYGPDAGDVAEQIAKIHLEDYVLGDTIFISNVGPYIEKLEHNYSDQTQGLGIAKPTFDSIMRTYQLHLDDYYKRS